MKTGFIKNIFVTGLSASVAGLAAAGQALAEPQSAGVQQSLQETSKALDKEKSISPELKSSLKKLLSNLAEEKAMPEPQSPTSPAPTKTTSSTDIKTDAKGDKPSAMQKLANLAEAVKLGGDFRLRHESDWRSEESGKRDRNRERVRARLGGSYEVDPGLTFEARLVTGPQTDPNSAHQTLGDTNDKWEVNFDRLNLKYAPDFLPGASATIGKFNHPFVNNPVFGELIWDGDVQPEGGYVNYTAKDVGGFSTLGITAGEYLVLNQDAGDEVWQSVVQGNAEAKLTENFTWSGAVGYYYYDHDLNPNDSTDIVADNSGNRVVDLDMDEEGLPDDYVSDFSILDVWTAVTFGGAGFPIVLSGEYIENFDADDLSTGWTVGAAAGSKKKKGDLNFYYQYQIVEQDAVFSAFAQDDFIFATNFRGHVFGTKYRLTDRVEAHLYAFLAKLDDGADDTESRGRFDLNVTF